MAPRQETTLERARLLASQAQEQIDGGNARTGILLALEPLNDTSADPYVPVAEQAAYQALTSGAWLDIVLRHEATVVAVHLSPGASRVVGGSADGNIRIWDAASGQERRVLRSHVDWVREVAFSPDGRSIVSASDDGTISLWNAFTGEERLVLRGPTGAGHGCRLLTRSTALIFSGGADGTVRVWNADDARSWTSCVVIRVGSMLSMSLRMACGWPAHPMTGRFQSGTQQRVRNSRPCNTKAMSGRSGSLLLASPL